MQFPIRRIFIALFVAMLAGSASAQTAEGIVHWSAQGPATAKAGSQMAVILKAVIQDGWHVYSISQMPGGPTRSVISVPPNQPFERDGSLTAPLPHTGFDPNFNLETETYEGTVQFKLPIRVAKTAPAGAKKIAIDVLFQTCNDTTCLPPHTTHLVVPIRIAAASSGGATAPSAKPTAAVRVVEPTNRRSGRG